MLTYEKTAYSLDQLLSFATAAETLNFTQAARLLHLSQPAISQHVRDLERLFGVTLFERRGRSMVLTPAGERFASLSQEVLGCSRRVRDELHQFRGVPQGVLYVGAESTPGIYALPHALGAFSRKFPGVRASMKVAESEFLQAALREGTLDLLLLEEALEPRHAFGWEQSPFLTDELVLAVPSSHPWAGRGEIALEALTSQHFILRQADSAIRRMHSNALAQAGFDPAGLAVRFELSSTEGIKHAILAGLGVGFVPRCSMAVEIEAGLLDALRLREVRLSRPWWLVRPREGREVASLARFEQLLAERSWLPASLGLTPC